MAVNYDYLRLSFISGEIDPQIAWRSDTQQLNSSSAIMRNFMPTIYGSVSRTPGTQFIAEVQDSNHVSRLLPFEASDNAYYLIEFGNQVGRIFANDELIEDDRGLVNGTFDGNTNGWTQRLSGTGIISWDIGTNRPLLSGGGAGNEARLYQTITNPSTSQYTVSIDVVTNAITYRVGVNVGDSSLGTGTLSVGSAQQFTFTPSTNDSIVYIEFEATSSSEIDNVILTSPDFTFDPPYLQDALPDLKFAQYNDVMYDTHEQYIPRRLVRRANNWWQFHTFDSSATTVTGDPSITYTEGPYIDYNTTAVTLTPSGTSGGVSIAASSPMFVAEDIGRLIRWRSGPSTGSPSQSYAGNGTQKNFNITFTYTGNPQGNGSGILVYSVSSVGVYTLQTNPTNYTISSDGTQVVFGTAPASGVTITIIPSYTTNGVYGIARITGFSDTSNVSVTVLSNFDAAMASTDWALGAFAPSVGYPRAVGFHEQRLWFGGTTAYPDKIWGSASGDYHNFRPDSAQMDGTVTADAAVSLAAASRRLSRVEWLQSRINLIVGTSSSLYELAPNGNGISATDLPSVLKRNENGTRNVEGVAIGTAVLYASSSGLKVLEADYALYVNMLQSSEMSIMAAHRFTSPIKRMVFQEEPDYTVWFLKEDGTLTACTYNKIQQIQAFSEQTIAGTDVFIEDICALRSQERTELYMIVRRTINGATKRYIEKLRPRFLNQDIETAWFVHSGVVYDATQTASLTTDGVTGTVIVNASSAIFSVDDVGRYIKINGSSVSLTVTQYIGPTSVYATCNQTLPSRFITSGTWSLSVTHISGLDHLEGETVSILADGGVMAAQVVSSGAITLTHPSYYVIVGLNYTSTLTTNDYNIDGGSGASFGKKRKVREITFNVYESVGGTIKGLAGSNTDDIPLSFITSSMDQGQSLFTGKVNMQISSDFDYNAQVTVEQDDPLPLTILGMVLKTTFGD